MTRPPRAAATWKPFVTTSASGSCRDLRLPWLQPDDRLHFISRGRNLGFSLEEIRSLLRLDDDPSMSCGDVDAIARSHLSDIQRRVTELQRIAAELERVIAQCAGGERGTCTILGALKQSGGEGSGCSGPGACA